MYCMFILKVWNKKEIDDEFGHYSRGLEWTSHPVENNKRQLSRTQQNSMKTNIYTYLAIGEEKKL